MRFVSLLLATVAFAVCATVFGEKLTDSSFDAPFDDVDAGGARIAGRSWRSGGNTVVNQNFIRLTPDRQSKKGSVWSRKALGVPSASAVLKFRISGQGKNFFGDGLALWFVQSSYWVEGDLHGLNEKFTGVGIVMDTFKNTETLAQHRDVTVLVNDGTRTREVMMEKPVGCNANVRYHSERADFSVTDSSRVKVTIDDQFMTVHVDAKSSGTYSECASRVPLGELGLPVGWLRRAHVGVTASTGQLADNHDILSLGVYSDEKQMEIDEEAEANKKQFVLPSSSPSLQIRALEDSINLMLGEREVLEHHIEHELAAVNDHIDTLIAKLEKREDKSEGRIADLETMISSSVEESLNERMRKLEAQMRTLVSRQTIKVEQSVQEARTRVDGIEKDMGSWKWPLLSVLLLLIAVFGAITYFYVDLRKRHLL